MIERTSGTQEVGAKDPLTTRRHLAETRGTRDERRRHLDEHAPRQEDRAARVARAAALLAIVFFGSGANVSFAATAEHSVALTIPGATSAPRDAVAPRIESTRPVPATRIEAIEHAGDELLEIVRDAHRGDLPQARLRAARIGVERRLARTLSTLPADLRPSDGPRFDRAVARLNQVIIRSQEWEAFGARPRPEWGWDPQREIRALEADDAALDAGEIVVAGVR